jgi:tetratricopeptide (TPR) repeat protein
MVMVVMNDSGSETGNMTFFSQVIDRAISYRLSFAQKEMHNHQALECEMPNLWEAIRQSYQQKAWESLSAFRDTIQPFLDLRGYWKQSIALNEWAYEGALALGDTLRAVHWTHVRADILHQQGNYQEAEKLYQECEEMFRMLGEDTFALKSSHMRSLVLRAQGRYSEAERLCKAAIAEARKLGLSHWLAHPLYVLALLVRDHGDLQKAEQLIEQSIALLTNTSSTNEDAMIAQCYHFLGETTLLRGNLAKARTLLDKSLGLSQQVGIMRRVAATQRVLGDLERIEGCYVEAEHLYDEALNIVTRLGDQPELAKLLLSRAKLMMQLGQKREAIMLLKGARSTFEEIGDERGVTSVSLLLDSIYSKDCGCKH